MKSYKSFKYYNDYNRSKINMNLDVEMEANKIHICNENTDVDMESSKVTYVDETME